MMDREASSALGSILVDSFPDDNRKYKKSDNPMFTGGKGASS